MRPRSDVAAIAIAAAGRREPRGAEASDGDLARYRRTNENGRIAPAVSIRS